jgi:polyadenylation factor subunit 2
MYSKRHNQGVKRVRWNISGTYFISSAKDRFVNLYDFRKHEQEVHKINLQTIADAITWHPIYENVFMTGDQLGTISYWNLKYTLPNARQVAPKTRSCASTNPTRPSTTSISTDQASS